MRSAVDSVDVDAVRLRIGGEMVRRDTAAGPRIEVTVAKSDSTTLNLHIAQPWGCQWQTSKCPKVDKNKIKKLAEILGLVGESVKNILSTHCNCFSPCPSGLGQRTKEPKTVRRKVSKDKTTTTKTTIFVNFYQNFAYTKIT